MTTCDAEHIHAINANNERHVDPESRKLQKMILVSAIALLAFIIFTRTWKLDADPPSWVSSDYITDEGWWTDSARGKIFFNDYFSDALGTSFLVTPIYTFILKNVYQYFGVGLVQSRLVASFSTIMIILIGAIMAWKLAGIREAFIYSLLLAISPFFWVHGRLALQEATQTLFIIASLALFLAKRENFKPWLIVSGMSMAAAIAVKPNTINLGLLPIIIAVFGTQVIMSMNKDPNQKIAIKLAFVRVAYTSIGLILGLGILLLIHIIPHWDQFWKTLLAEAGSGKAGIVDRIVHLGLIMVTWNYDGDNLIQEVWRVPMLSPTIFIGTWLYMMVMIVNMKNNVGNKKSLYIPWQMTIVLWILFSWIAIESSYIQPDRRFMGILPGMAILACITIKKLLTGEKIMITEKKNIKYITIYRLVLWSLILFPLYIIFKPYVTNSLVHSLALIKLEYDRAGIGYTAAWLVAILVLAITSRKEDKIAALLYNRVGILLLVVAAIYETNMIARYFLTCEPQLAKHQEQLAKMVNHGDIVLGDVSASIFNPLPVRTVRRIKSNEFSTSPPNDHRWDVNNPDYVLEIRRRNYHQEKSFYEDIIKKGYHSIYYFGVGEKRDNISQYEYELYGKKDK